MMMVTKMTVKKRLLWSLLEPAECTWIVTLASLWFRYFVDMYLTTLLLLLVYPRTHLWYILIHFSSHKLLTVLRFNLKSAEICCHWRFASPCPCHILKCFSMKLFIWLAVWLTPSLPEPVKCSGWKMYKSACKQYIFRSYNFYFQCFEFRWKSFHMAVRKIKPETVKGLKIYAFTGQFQMTSWQWRS